MRIHSLPKPSDAAAALSAALTRQIIAQIGAHGSMPFAEFMHAALYTQQLGYYQNFLTPFGAQGDFVTAPEISPLFAQCIANYYLAMQEQMGVQQLLEFGAGSGALALQCLHYLQTLDRLPERYYILETSASLVAAQQEKLSALPAVFERVQWLTSLPDDFTGMVLANEVLDAMPVEAYQVTDTGVARGFITYTAEFAWSWQVSEPAPEQMPAQIRQYPGYRFEINHYLKPWLAALKKMLRKGCVLLIDYGYPRAEYFHPQRSAGTLVCHYRHTLHDDPLRLIGLQDITAHVNFSDVRDYAEDLGFVLSGYTTQAQFLLDTGLLELATRTDPMQQLALAQQIKTLTLPSEMGERFQVIALGTHSAPSPRGFRQDLRHRL